MNAIQSMEMTFVMMMPLAQTLMVHILANAIQDIKIPRRLKWDMSAKVSIICCTVTCYNAYLDIDECLDRTHDCQQICINLPGTFACTCEKGFSTDTNEIDCTDNDECALRSHNCHVNAGKDLILDDLITV